MQKMKLTDVQPTISFFHRAIGGITNRGVYDKTMKPRPYDAFVYVLYGQTRYTFADRTVLAKAGDILYLSRGSVYSMEVLSERYGFIFADFLFDAPDDVEFLSTALPAANGKTTENLFHRMLASSYIRHDTVIPDCVSLLYAVYSDFIRAARDSTYISPDKRRRLEDSLKYIEEHMSDPSLTVQEVAAAVQMSNSYFRKTFTDIYKITPIKYIIMMRMVQARQKLRYTDIPVTAIAEQLGFSKLYYFCRSFKREYGCTPSEYRLKHAGFPKT